MILNGWKEIAAYVNSSIRTVQRWEKAGLPVARPLPSSRGSVIAHSEQLDSWLGLSHSEGRPPAPSFHPEIGREYLHQNLVWSRLLGQQLEMTRLEMSGHMSTLQIQVALLQENISRMKLAESLYANPTSLSPAEVSAAAAMEQRRRSA